jgi:SET domain-containing protein
MLRVNARKGPSRIHGFGLIAQEFIPAGSVIWEFVDGFDLRISPGQLASFSAATRLQVLQYAYLDPESRCYFLSSDDDRFTNHSTSPNTVTRDHRTVAACDIFAGEEITADYAELHFDEDEPALIAAEAEN